MMENVPGLALDKSLEVALQTFGSIGYFTDWKIVNVKEYGVPQSRKRLVLVGSRLAPIQIAHPTNKKKNSTPNNRKVTSS